jgi:hypothetical protein
LSHNGRGDVPERQRTFLGSDGRRRRSEAVSGGQLGRQWMTSEAAFDLAKVEVASSNLVIRSTEPRFRGVSPFMRNN